MEIKHFRLIKTIVEEGSIANSSHKLFLTQSALSHQLRELEESLGFKVFHRTRSNWTLTEEGEELYKLANTILEKIHQGFNNIKYIHEGSKGLIRISTECYSFYQGVPNFTQKMAILYPQIEVELILDLTHQPISKLLSNDLDIAIVTSQPTSHLLSSIAFFEDEIFAIMHQENQLADKLFIEASDFTSIPLIIHSFPLETVAVYEKFLKPNHIVPQKIMAIPLTEITLEMIHTNMGITCMPKWALNLFKISDDIQFKRLGLNGLKRTHYLVYRKGDKPKKYIKDFIANFVEDFHGK